MFEKVYNICKKLEGAVTMKYTTITKLVLQISKLFIDHIKAETRCDVYFQYKIVDKKQFRVLFIAKSNDYQFNEKLVNDFMKKYGLTTYIKIKDIKHTKVINNMETSLELELTDKAKRIQSKLLTLLLMKDK